MKNENWLPISGYEGLYEVSDMGRVRSVRGFKKYVKGVGLKWFENNKILSTYGAKPCVVLSKDRSTRRLRVDALVLSTFSEGGDCGMNVVHKNGDISDNRLENLYWSNIPMPCIGSERWAAIPGYGGFYMASSIGRVFSLERRSSSGNTVGGRLMVPWVDKHGYERLVLHGNSSRFVHQLVLEAFVGPCPDGMQASHQNGDPSDNRLENLKWETPFNNSQKKRIHGTMTRGSGIGISKLSEADVLQIVDRLNRGDTQSDIAREYEVSQFAISAIRAGKSWSWLTGISRASGK